MLWASFSKRFVWGHWQLGALFEKEKCSCFVALLQSVQKLMRKWMSFSDQMPEINCFPEGHRTEGGWSVAFKKEDCIWQQEEEEGREVVSLSQILVSYLDQMYWNDMKHPTPAYFPWWDCTKTVSDGAGAIPKSINYPGTLLLHFTSPEELCDSLSRDLDNQKIKEEEPRVK